MDYLRSVPILQPLKEPREFNLHAFLNYNTSILGIKLPYSYGAAISDISIQKMIEIEEKMSPNIRSDNQIQIQQPQLQFQQQQKPQLQQQQKQQSQPQQQKQQIQPQQLQMQYQQHQNLEFQELSRRLEAEKMRVPQQKQAQIKDNQVVSKPKNVKPMMSDNAFDNIFSNTNNPNAESNSGKPVGQQGLFEGFNFTQNTFLKNDGPQNRNEPQDTIGDLKMKQILSQDLNSNHVYQEFSHQTINSFVFNIPYVEKTSPEALVKANEIYSPRIHNQAIEGSKKAQEENRNQPDKNLFDAFTSEGFLGDEVGKEGEKKEIKSSSPLMVKTYEEVKVAKSKSDNGSNFQNQREGEVEFHNPLHDYFGVSGGANANQIALGDENTFNFDDLEVPGEEAYGNVIPDTKNGQKNPFEGFQFTPDNLPTELKHTQSNPEKVQKPNGNLDWFDSFKFTEVDQNQQPQQLQQKEVTAQNKETFNFFATDPKEEQKKEEKAPEFNFGNLKSPEQQSEPVETKSKNMNADSLKQFIISEVSKNVNDWIIDYKSLEFGKKIGSGGSAEVYQGSWRGADVAIKKIKSASMEDTHMKEFEREISALVKLRPHANLVSLTGVSFYNESLYIITEFCHGGTLFEWLHKRRDFQITWSQKVKIAKDVACGMLYLHSCEPPIMHRDLKSLNLLLDAPLERWSDRLSVKIADFGLAKIQEVNQEKMTGLMGTYHWMAPEIFEDKDYTIKADVFSYGIVLWEICSRQTPYQNLKSPAAIMKYVTVEKGRPDLKLIPSSCPPELIDMIIRCWDHDPSKRPSFKEIVDFYKNLK